MENTDKMIRLCMSMVSLNEKSNSVFAPINKIIWEKKLDYWLSLRQ